MSTQHTPGPWVMRPVPGLGCICIAQPKKMHGHAYITEPTGEPNRLGPMEYANAALIAAAPDLLEALDELLAHVEWRRRCEGEEAGPNDVTHRCRAAIAKAEGRQS